MTFKKEEEHSDNEKTDRILIVYSACSCGRERLRRIIYQSTAGDNNGSTDEADADKDICGC